MEWVFQARKTAASAFASLLRSRYIPLQNGIMASWRRLCCVTLYLCLAKTYKRSENGATRINRFAKPSRKGSTMVQVNNFECLFVHDRVKLPMPSGTQSKTATDMQVILAGISKSPAPKSNSIVPPLMQQLVAIKPSNKTLVSSNVSKKKRVTIKSNNVSTKQILVYARPASQS